MSGKRTPAGLGAAGGRFWRAIVADFEPAPDELVLLEAACRQLDEIAQLEGALAGVPVLVAGARGQQRPHPLYAELRGHRLALKSLLQALELDADGATGDEHGTSRSHEARRLALVRWHGPRKAGAS